MNEETPEKTVFSLQPEAYQACISVRVIAAVL
jgi:hypothetical protein